MGRARGKKAEPAELAEPVEQTLWLVLARWGQHDKRSGPEKAFAEQSRLFAFMARTGEGQIRFGPYRDQVARWVFSAEGGARTASPFNPSKREADGEGPRSAIQRLAIGGEIEPDQSAWERLGRSLALGCSATVWAELPAGMAEEFERSVPIRETHWNKAEWARAGASALEAAQLRMAIGKGGGAEPASRSPRL